jgi:hypothetical protein
MNTFFASLMALIQPSLTSLEGKLASVGATFGAGLMAVALGFTSAQRGIFTDVIAFWQASYHAAIAVTGTSELDAIEQASTAALGEFIKDEEAAGNQEIEAIITLLTSAAKSSVAAAASSV